MEKITALVPTFFYFIWCDYAEIYNILLFQLWLGHSKITWINWYKLIIHDIYLKKKYIHKYLSCKNNVIAWFPQHFFIYLINLTIKCNILLKMVEQFLKTKNNPNKQ